MKKKGMVGDAGPMKASAFVVGSVQLSNAGTPAKICPGLKPVLGVQLKAAKANTGQIYISMSDGSSTKCYPLDAKESLFLPLSTTDDICGLAEVNNERIHFVVI